MCVYACVRRGYKQRAETDYGERNGRCTILQCKDAKCLAASQSGVSKSIYWHQCVNIMVLRCSISHFAPFVFYPPTHASASLLVFNSLHFFFYPSAFSSVCGPLSFASFLTLIPSSLSFHLFPPETLWPQDGGGVCIIILSQTLVQYIHTLTLSRCLKAAASLIETNGKITGAAVLNNSPHSHLSGSMLPK